MRALRTWVGALLSGVAGATLLTAVAMAAEPAKTDFWQAPASPDREDYLKQPMPPGVQVISTELEGPVFADANGKTLYSWPLSRLRNGDTGDRRDSGLSSCTDEVLKVTSGLMSPYPGGLLLPNLDQRKSCVDAWPPLLAPEDAKPVGQGHNEWTVIKRADNKLQWAYGGYPVYTSNLDKKPGDTLGGSKLQRAGDGPAVRVPVGPPANIPPEFAGTDPDPARYGPLQTSTGRMVTDHKGFSVYTSDGDEPNKSKCTDECMKTWEPVRASATAKPNGEWGVIERSPGIRQWTFRKKPLYTHVMDPHTRSFIGSDVPGWHNVYTQRALPPPNAFTVQDSIAGQVLGDAQGKTVYIYNCGDDARDQLACDHPDTEQAYRLAICGNSDPKLCVASFPYVSAAAGAKSDSKLWSVMLIDPDTGRRATQGQAGALSVWAYRERPVYTCNRDQQPGDANCDSYGEFNGRRNGYRAFWLRDDFGDSAYSF
jgi:predicted lipoprotein with Yx(FWY)xxD motif